MSSDYIQANTNGRLHDAREAAVSPLNRGYLYGDAIYEVWRTYDRVLFAWAEHWQRLQRSAAALHLTMPWTPEFMLMEIKRAVQAWRRQTGRDVELYVRLQITRGGGPIGLDPGLADQPDFVLLVQPNRGLPPEKLERGYVLSIEHALRRNPPDALNPAWKTGNYLNNVLCLRAARARGADDVLMLNLQGEITEASTSNIAFVRDGRIHTPPLAAGILGGITRALLLQEIAPRAGVERVETSLTPADLAGMEEAFMLSTTRDLAPVAAIDEHRFRMDASTVTMRLKAAFAAYALEHGQRHPKLWLDQ
jgi:branched-chain amino acid aminotransferase